MMSSKKISVLLICGVLSVGGCIFGSRWSADAAIRPLNPEPPAAPKGTPEAGSSGSGSGGPVVELKSLARPKRARSSAEAPAGPAGAKAPGEAVPGAGVDGVPAPAPSGRVVFSGDPLDPLIGEPQLGLSLDKIFAIADHAGYNLILRARYVATAIDTPYSYSLMKGRRRLATLFFDRNLKLSMIK